LRFSIADFQVQIDTTDTSISVILEFKGDIERSLGNRRNISRVVEAVLRAGKNFLLSNLDDLSEDDNTSQFNLKLEAANSDIILNGTASVNLIIFIGNGLVVQGDGGWLPWVVRTGAAGPVGSVVSVSQSKEEGNKDEGSHREGREGIIK